MTAFATRPPDGRVLRWPQLVRLGVAGLCAAITTIGLFMTAVYFGGEGNQGAFLDGVGHDLAWRGFAAGLPIGVGWLVERWASGTVRRVIVWVNVVIVAVALVLCIGTLSYLQQSVFPSFAEQKAALQSFGLPPGSVRFGDDHRHLTERPTITRRWSVYGGTTGQVCAAVERSFEAWTDPGTVRRVRDDVPSCQFEGRRDGAPVAVNLGTRAFGGRRLLRITMTKK